MSRNALLHLVDKPSHGVVVPPFVLPVIIALTYILFVLAMLSPIARGIVALKRKVRRQPTTKIKSDPTKRPEIQAPKALLPLTS
jgi:hypothetical protein